MSLTEVPNTVSERASYRGVTALVATTVIAAAATAAVLASVGVKPQALLRFTAYEVLWVIFPGAIAFAVLGRPGASASRRLAVAWTLGYLLEIGVFIASGAVGHPGLVRVWPALVLLLLGPIAWRRRDIVIAQVPTSAGAAAGVAAVAGVLVLFLVPGYFLATPLPGTVGPVSYYVDLVHDLSLAGEALHQWPITDPHVSGEPFSYYSFPFIHMAAAARVTGLELPLILFRLYIVPQVALCVLLMYVLGVAVTGRRAGGVLAALLAFLVGELDASASSAYPFLYTFFFGLHYSPTFLLGIIFFLALLTELVPAQTHPNQFVWSSRRLGLLVLLAIGCIGSKSLLMPMVLGGIGCAAIWPLITHRRLDPVPFAALGVGLALAVALAIYGESRAGSVSVAPFVSVRAMPLVASYPLAAALPTALLGVFGVRFLGLVWAASRMRRRSSGATTYLLGAAASGLLPFYFLDILGSQFYLQYYAVLAAAPLTAAALLALWQARTRLSRLVLALGVVPLTIVGMLDLPLDQAETMRKWLRDEPTWATTNENLTTGLWRGLRWIRQHTDHDTVIAVNNYFNAPGDRRYFYYSAFAERPAFLEGWMYSDRTHAIGYAEAALGRVHPFPDRLELNDRVFQDWMPAALDELRRQGVTHVLVDKVHGADGRTRHVDEAMLVYSNPDVDIYELRSP